MNTSLRVAALGALYIGDKPDFFRECLGSIYTQTLQIPVFIVVDGPLNPDLEDVISEYEFLGVNYLRREENLGLAAALQFGVEFLSDEFDYVIRFDSDDRNSANRFEKMVALAEREGPDLASSHMKEINSEELNSRVDSCPSRQKK